MTQEANLAVVGRLPLSPLASQRVAPLPAPVSPRVAPMQISEACIERFWRRLRMAARAPYRAAGHHAWHFAKGKLRGDAVFREVLEHGLVPPHARVLDVGCGQGLLISALLAAGEAERHGGWPTSWAAAPVGVRCTGIELAARDVERANAALGAAADFIQADMREAGFPAADVVVLFDVLHYVEPAAQDLILERARDALGEGGTLLLRVGDAALRHRHAASAWVDRLVMAFRGAGRMPLSSRSGAAWTDRLQALGFEVEARPMNGRLFANVLLIGRLRPKR